VHAKKNTQKTICYGAIFFSRGKKSRQWVKTAGHWCALSFDQSDNDRHHEQHNKNEKQDFRDLDGTGCNAAKTEERGDQRDDQKYGSVMKHGVSSCDVPGPNGLRCGGNQQTLCHRRSKAENPVFTGFSVLAGLCHDNGLDAPGVAVSATFTPEW
jgi:hypothetical protein